MDVRTIGLTVAGVGVTVLAVLLARRERRAQASSEPSGIRLALGREQRAPVADGQDLPDLCDRPLPRSVAALHAPAPNPAS